MKTCFLLFLASLSSLFVLIRHDDKEAAVHVWKSVEAARGQNQSGSVIIEIVDNEPNGFGNQKISIDYDLAREVIYRVDHLPSGTKTHTLMHPEFVAHWNGEITGCIDILDVSSALAKRHIVDIRSIGVVASSEWLQGLGLEDFKKLLGAYSSVTCEKSQGITTLNYVAVEEPFVKNLEFQIDESNGSQVISGVARLTPVSDTNITLTIELRTKWEKQSEVWLPVSSHLIRDNGSESKMVCKWSNINKKLRGLPNAPEEIPAFNGTSIVDHRLGPKPVVVGKIGE